ncbi:MAG: type II/IV secretion system protein [Lacunisphaera sp.]|nr:type II/IV secretion system protein [Lacunisphaera sp.]
MLAPTAVLPASLRLRLNEEQLRALAEAPRARRPALLAEGLHLSEPAARLELSRASGLPVATDLRIEPGAIPLLPARLIRDFHLAPLAVVGADEHQLNLATPWPPDEVMTDWIATFTPRQLHWYLAPAERIGQLILDHYGVGAGSLDGEDEPDPAMVAPAAGDIEADEDAAVVRFVSDVISQAIEDGATDIHFEPQEGQLRIRYRVDGLLIPVPVPENLLRYQDAIISRLKIMARLNISEKRLPQDGRINFKVSGSSLDIRVSTIPTIYAESVSLRLLNQKREAYTMERLGLGEPERVQITKILEYPHGIILVTGPTGSGKSTSLNAFLRQINSTDLRIVTVEDPIEYEVPGANQLQVRPEIGLTFASALRHILRQDPDVIMVGEIRDRETADIAIRASLTGHLVFTTLHTNDAPGAITRLVDMGIEPFLIASALELVIAQRLVRRLCPHCSKPEPVNRVKFGDAIAILGLEPTETAGVTTLIAPVGCDRCRGTGFRGRVGLFEILRPNDELHDLIVKREPTRSLVQCARAHGMRTLAQSGWGQVRAGHTTLDEVLRVINISDR